jgi:GT2 family glycosyltransferase
MAERRVTMVVLTHNRREEVCRSVARLVALPDACPVLVVDNGSTDDTAEAIARRFPEVEVVRLPDNRGAAGRNAGVDRAATPYVALSDDDTWWAPGALSRAADLLDAHPKLALVTGRVLVGDTDREDPTCAVMEATPLAPDPGCPGFRVLGFLAGASVVRRGSFLARGGFHPRFFLGGEERLLAVDLVAWGEHLAYVPDVVAHHHPSPLRDAPGRRRLLARNALWFAMLRRRWPLVLAETWWLAARARRDPLARQALREALGGMRWVWRERAPLPPDVERMVRAVEGAGPPAPGAAQGRARGSAITSPLR